jgi:hypothetical protein
MIYGMAGYSKWRVLLETQYFAVVQVPGEMYLSGQTRRYGPTTYYLVCKFTPTHGGHGMRHWTELRTGGRIGARIKRQWQAILEECERYSTP